MLTVVIYVNGSPILARSARNAGKVDEEGRTLYHADDDRLIRHFASDGAVSLAIKMLKDVKEP